MQVQAQFSVGASGGVKAPIGDMGNVVVVGGGGEALGRYQLNDRLFLGLNVGVVGFGPVDTLENQFRNAVDQEFTYSLLKVTAAGDYRFRTEGVAPYVGLELGLYQTSISTLILDGVGGVAASTKNNVGVGFAPRAGLLIPLGGGFSLDAFVDWNFFSTEEYDPETDAIESRLNSFVGFQVGGRYFFEAN